MDLAEQPLQKDNYLLYRNSNNIHQITEVCENRLMLKSIDSGEPALSFYNEVNPILLDELWLQTSFKFKRHGKRHFWTKGNKVGIYKDEDDNNNNFYLAIKDYNNVTYHSTTIEMRYVHILQNMFHLIEGNKLIL